MKIAVMDFSSTALSLLVADVCDLQINMKEKLCLKFKCAIDINPNLGKVNLNRIVKLSNSSDFEIYAHKNNR